MSRNRTISLARRVETFSAARSLFYMVGGVALMALALSAAGGARSALWAQAKPGSVTPSAPVRPTSAPSVHGRVPILEYHLIGDTDGRWTRTPDHLRRDFELLYARGYRPVTVSELVDKKLDIPAGTSPVVITFDDASPGQFKYIEKNGQLAIDPNSAVGVWLAFHAKHPDWRNKAVFCVLPAGQAGHAFFGDTGIEGQKTEWRFKKVRFLADQGFEICGHTLWHAELSKYSDAVVQEQIARGVMAIDSAAPGLRVRTFALPKGMWPKNRSLAQKGSWKDPHGGRVVSYRFDAILEVAGRPTVGPNDARFNPLSLNRQQVLGNALEQLLDRIDKETTVPGAKPTRSP